MQASSTQNTIHQEDGANALSPCFQQFKYISVIIEQRSGLCMADATNECSYNISSNCKLSGVHSENDVTFNDFQNKKK